MLFLDDIHFFGYIHVHWSTHQAAEERGELSTLKAQGTPPAKTAAGSSGKKVKSGRGKRKGKVEPRRTPHKGCTKKSKLGGGSHEVKHQHSQQKTPRDPPPSQLGET